MRLIKEALPMPAPFESNAKYMARIMRKYRISRAQAFRWIKQGYALVREYPLGMPANIDFRAIAKRTAYYVAASSGDRHLMDECEQEALIALWKDSDKIRNAVAGQPYIVTKGKHKGKTRLSKGPVELAHYIARVNALNALKWWRLHRNMPLDAYLNTYENEDEDLEIDGPQDTGDTSI